MPKCDVGKGTTVEKPCEPLPDCKEGVYEVPKDKSCNPLPFREKGKKPTQENPC